MAEPTLTETQKATYERDGVLPLRGVVRPATLASVQARFETIVSELADEMHASGDLSTLYEDEPFATRWARIREEVPSTAPSVWRRVLIDPAIHRLWFEPGLLGAARSILGDDIRAYDLFNGRPREPHAESQTIHWHQDAFNSPAWSADDGPVLTFWIPLVPVDASSGCLAAVPGSHHAGLLESRTDEFGITHLMHDDEPEGTDYPLEPGDALMFNDLVLHRSRDNVADYVRWSIDIRYSADTVSHRQKSPGGFRVAGGDAEPETFEEWSSNWDPKTGVMKRQLRRLDLYANSLGKDGRDVRTY